MLLKDFVEVLENYGTNWELRFELIEYDEHGFPLEDLVFTRGELLGVHTDTDYFDNPIEIPVYEVKATVVNMIYDDSEDMTVHISMGIQNEDGCSYKTIVIKQI